jgi:hypothetical protein
LALENKRRFPSMRYVPVLNIGIRNFASPKRDPTHLFDPPCDPSHPKRKRDNSGDLERFHRLACSTNSSSVQSLSETRAATARVIRNFDLQREAKSHRSPSISYISLLETFARANQNRQVFSAYSHYLYLRAKHPSASYSVFYRGTLKRGFKTRFFG